MAAANAKVAPTKSRSAAASSGGGFVVGFVPLIDSRFSHPRSSWRKRGSGGLAHREAYRDQAERDGVLAS